MAPDILTRGPTPLPTPSAVRRSAAWRHYCVSCCSSSEEVTCWELDTDVELNELCFTTLDDMTLCVTDCCTERVEELLDSTTLLPSMRTSLELSDSCWLVLDDCTSACPAGVTSMSVRCVRCVRCVGWAGLVVLAPWGGLPVRPGLLARSLARYSTPCYAQR